MTQFDSDDLAELFHADNGADAATIAGATVYGFYIARYDDALQFDGHQPAFRCVAADVTDVTVGTALTIAGQGYTVRSKQPDAGGTALLLLRRSS